MACCVGHRSQHIKPHHSMACHAMPAAAILGMRHLLSGPLRKPTVKRDTSLSFFESY